MFSLIIPFCKTDLNKYAVVRLSLLRSRT